MVSSNDSDEVLISRYFGGEMPAFETLYSRYRAPLYRFMLRSLRSKAEVEDLYHEVWSRIITASQRFSDATPGAFRAYLYQIARHLLIDRGRRATLQLVEADDPPEVASDAPAPDEQLHYADCGERLLLAIDGLPAEQREAFLLKEESGLSLEQIAALVSAGRETIKSRLRYAMKKLRELLEECL
ncbi:MAG TPA: sigma-70 family RNA polymerase sigma factor [Gammaproteobacteria bacterium]